MNFSQTLKGKSLCPASHVRLDLLKRRGWRSGPTPLLLTLHPRSTAPPSTPSLLTFSLHSCSGLLKLSPSSAPVPPQATVLLFLLSSCYLRPHSCQGSQCPLHLRPALCSPVFSPGSGPNGCCFLDSELLCLPCGPHSSTRLLSSSVLKTLLAFSSHLLGGWDVTRSSSVQAIWVVTPGSLAPPLNSACSRSVPPSPRPWFPIPQSPSPPSFPSQSQDFCRTSK